MVDLSGFLVCGENKATFNIFIKKIPAHHNFEKCLLECAVMSALGKPKIELPMKYRFLVIQHPFSWIYFVLLTEKTDSRQILEGMMKTC